MIDTCNYLCRILTLLDMICKVDTLQVFIGLAMKLAIGFEMCFVATQTTRVVVVVDDSNEILLIAQPRTIFVDVIIQLLEVVGIVV